MIALYGAPTPNARKIAIMVAIFCPFGVAE